MTKTATYLCIGCPLGCRLEVEEDEGHQIIEIRGFSCKRGKEYAAQEHSAPQRIVTTTVAVKNALYARLPVKTSAPVPKGSVVDVCKSLRHVSVSAPVKLGDVIVANVLGCGVDVIATRDLPATV